VLGWMPADQEAAIDRWIAALGSELP